MKLSLVAVALSTFFCSIFARELAKAGGKHTCTSTWWEDGYAYTEKDTLNPNKRRCIVLEVWKRVKHVDFRTKKPCDDLAICDLYPYDVTVKLLRDDLKFVRISYPEKKTTLTEVGDKKLKWSIDGKKTAAEFNGSYQLTVCFSGKNLGKTSTLKLVKPGVGVAISGTAPCGDDY